MSLRINTNIQAFTAQRSLNETMTRLNKSMTRLSTGLRINNAADDPAGLSISEDMRSQIQGINQAIRNSQDAVNMIKTAESALQEVQDLLKSVRGLAVHSANTATIDAAQLQANQTQLQSTVESIDRIGAQTAWGTKKLLNGNSGTTANVTNPSQVSSIFMSSEFAGDQVINGPVTISRVTSAEQATLTLGNSFAGLTDVIATVGTFVLNGYAIHSDGSMTVGDLIQKINEASPATGITANFAAGSVTISTVDYGSAEQINFFDPTNILHNSSFVSDAGANAVFDVTVNTDSGVQTVQFTGGRLAGDSGLKLTDYHGNSIVLTAAGNSGFSPAAQAGYVTAGAVTFQVGANAGQTVSHAMPTIFANRLGTGVVSGLSLSTIDLSNAQGAQDAIRIIDAAITEVSVIRGKLGSFQSQYLESNVRSLGVAAENLSASEAQIRDTDMAAEMTDYTKYQILQQSGVAMLAHANQVPQSVLQLLQGG